MATLWVCLGCRVAYEPGIPGCPECQHTDHEELTVPKNTSAGPSNAWEQPQDQIPQDETVVVAEAGPEIVDTPPAATVRKPRKAAQPKPEDA